MLRKIALTLLAIYQRYLRTTMPASCRFWPSCSEYTKQAFIKYGFFRGGLKGVKRLSRCHPFSPQAGYDPLE
ncbi:MAG: membrane protein insertion efficiency factor YidD [Candidatus Omnitrophica bacterium]|nr:membrane protein insertion efficiency factor YidD [Candidatus Omnitrophota bacterium]MBU1928982.1 membrane protein insertion efficiency factor YidD [Candidatus Omnitrophota bacterium]MBU2035703.1 membrane protein insertion efficiency factor YidD [Candidatus Omnitrophota bacterium]MBU2221738.1 membrane protein insertion efficiency factor YidD [Candidatus Omnitrophota bacterium]MBU2258559.1 membrane protein insertion efficiency factor YidD [Candidatus Omnitrophota bacterium]